MRVELSNPSARVRLDSLGAAIRQFAVRNATGALVNIVLAYDDQSEYAHDRYYLGSTLGRYAGRISNSQFKIEQTVYQLTANEGPHCLHGGANGFHQAQWQASQQSEHAVLFRHASPAGSGGFPGRLEVAVRYTLEAATLSIDYQASCDAPTVLNLSNHAYFNLNTDRDSTIDNHELQVHAQRYAELGQDKIPTGRLRDVADSSFDLRQATPLGERLNEDYFDHCFALNGRHGTLREAATLSSKQSGLQLKLLTTQPALQLYTAGAIGHPFRPRQALCLETQNFPDAPNRPQFPSSLLLPEQNYRHTTVFRVQAA